MAFYEPVHVVGTKTEGTPFQHFGGEDGRVVEKIRVYHHVDTTGKAYIRGIKVWLTGLHSKKFGLTSDSSYAEFQFQPGELITDLSLRGKDTPTAVAFHTSQGRSFATPTTGLESQTPVEVNVGSGIFIGVWGRSVPLLLLMRQLGFVFLRPIALAVIQDVYFRQPLRTMRFLLDFQHGQVAPSTTSQTVTAQAGGLGWPFRIDLPVQFEVPVEQASADQPYHGKYHLVLDNGSVFDWGVTGNYS